MLSYPMHLKLSHLLNFVCAKVRREALYTSGVVVGKTTYVKYVN